MLTTRDLLKARSLYRRFFNLYPDQKNPTDINTVEKAVFLVIVGFENIQLMQAARKEGHPFTKR